MLLLDFLALVAAYQPAVHLTPNRQKVIKLPLFFIRLR